MSTIQSVYLTRIYALTGEFGTIFDGYVAGTPPSAFEWVLDPAAGAKKTAPAAGTAWKNAAKYHAEISYRAYCRGYFFDDVALAIELAKIDRLKDAESPRRPLLTAAQISSITERMVQYTRTDSAAVQADIDAFLTKSVELITLLDGGFVLANKDAYTALYAGAELTAKVNSAFNNAAESVWLWANVIKTQTDGTLNFVPTGDFYQSNNPTAVKNAVKAQLASLFVADSVTGIKAIDRNALVDYLAAGFLGLTVTPIAIAPAGTDAYDTARRGADLIMASLTAEALQLPQKLKTTTVTASGVNAKKAELEALANKVDLHYSRIKESSYGTLEKIVSDFLGDADIKSNLPQIITRNVASRFYVTTWVTVWGEESAPSPPSDLVEVDQNDVCLVNRGTNIPADRDVIGWRLYRSNSSNSGADFQLVPDLASISSSSTTTSAATPIGQAEEVVRKVYAEINRTGLTGITDGEVDWWVTESIALARTPAQIRAAMIAAVLDETPSVVARVPAAVRATAQALTATGSLFEVDGSYNCNKLASIGYIDAVASSQLGEVIPTVEWLEPPAKLAGMTAMANGIMAGHYDNTVCFCEAYAPYAWPVRYQIPLDFPIVGKAAFGQTLVVGTTKSIYLISGSDPESMSAQVIPGEQACVSARSMVSVDTGVVFASADGLCLANLNGVRVVTASLFTRADWQGLNPSSIIGAWSDGVYYFLYAGGCFALDIEAGKLIRSTITGTAFYRDGLTDTLYTVSGTSIKALMFGASFRTGVYKTGKIKFAAQSPLAWLQVDSDFVDPVTVKWYGDGALVHTATVTSVTPVRLPVGRYLEHEVEISTQSRVTSVTLAGHTKELQNA